MIHLKAWLEEWLDELTPILKQGQTFQLQYHGPNEVCSDPKVLKNVVMNLLSNAVKFSPENKEIQLSVEQVKGNLQLVFQDQGMGSPHWNWNTCFNVSIGHPMLSTFMEQAWV